MVKKVSFLPPETREELLDNGITVQIARPIAGYILSENPQYFSEILTGMFGRKATFAATIEGVTLSLKNKTDKVIIIKWSESAVSVGSYSGMPFLGGMKYKDAGNPSVTADSIIIPGHSIQTDLYLSRVKFGNKGFEKEWSIIGEPIRKDASTKISLAIKIQISNNPFAQYYTITSPPLTVI